MGAVHASYQDDEKQYGHGIQMERELAYHYERPVRYRHRPSRNPDVDDGSSVEDSRPRPRRPLVQPVYIIRTFDADPEPAPVAETRIPPPPDPIWRNSVSSSKTGLGYRLGEASNVQYIVIMDRSVLPILDPAVVDTYHGRGASVGEH
ncbi:unnamed protein product [Ixodes hexagonus]